MEVWIINRPKEDHAEADRLRFETMLTSLAHAGVTGRYFSIQMKKELTNTLQAEKPDLIYCANYYLYDENNELTSVHALLNQLNFPYIGSAPEKLELVLSKIALKEKWQRDNILTPRFFKIFERGSKVFGLEEAIQAKDFPYILKPDREGNSRGLSPDSVVFDQGALTRQSAKLLKKYKTILAEKYLGNAEKFHEYTVAMIGNGNNKFLMPAEIRLKQRKSVRIVTSQDKDDHLTRAIPVEDPLLFKKLTDFSRKAFESAGMRDYARCDLIMIDEWLYAIEINGLPMVPDEWFENCAKTCSLNEDQYLNAILLAGLVRCKKYLNKEISIPEKMKILLPEPVMARLLAG
ncbi:MAG: hypothetical protein WA110_05080 [Anaerolineaceae bacterium]